MKEIRHKGHILYDSTYVVNSGNRKHIGVSQVEEKKDSDCLRSKGFPLG
jgi:hypothetical protein